MSEVTKVIEIVDSDDDNVDCASNANHEVNVQLVQDLDLNPPPSVSNAMETNEQPTLETGNRTENSKISPVTPTTVPVTPASSAPSGTRRSRKSIHQPMRASPEMQFETIALDDDEEEHTTVPIGKTTTDEGVMPATSTAAGQIHTKIFKTMPKILASKSSPTEEQLDTVFNDLFLTEDVVAMLRKIAKERVRINYLLKSNGMPEINFSLYTQPDRLNFQLEDRLRQHKIRRDASARTCPTTPKKRVLTPSTSQHSSK